MRVSNLESRKWSLENGARGPVGYQPTSTRQLQCRAKAFALALLIARSRGAERGRRARSDCRLITYWPARSIFISGAKKFETRIARQAKRLPLSSQQDCISLALRAPCPNFEPRAHARLTGLTTITLTRLTFFTARCALRLKYVSHFGRNVWQLVANPNPSLESRRCQR